MSFVSYKLGLILSVGALQVAALHHLSWSLLPPSKWRDSLFHKHLLISSPFCFSFLFLTPFFHTSIHLCLSFFIILCFFSCSLFPHLHHHIHYICVFPLPSRSDGNRPTSHNHIIRRMKTYRLCTDQVVRSDDVSCT